MNDYNKNNEGNNDILKAQQATLYRLEGNLFIKNKMQIQSLK